MTDMTTEDFSRKMDRLEEDFKTYLLRQKERLLQDKPKDEELSMDLVDEYAKFQEDIDRQLQTFGQQVKDHATRYKKDYKDLVDRQQNATFPGLE
jgi:hypothetical protein